MKSFIENLRKHELIREKVQETKPHISAFNFTRKAFRKAIWDSTNIRARGLFLDTELNIIVARSYEKFFNRGERRETFDEHLKSNLQFPISIYKKENGFLGILGYDRKNDELLFCSKSTIDGDYAIEFKKAFYNLHDKQHIDNLKTVLKEQNVSMVFEVVLPIFDPHIIEYTTDTIVLLDVIHNEVQFNKMSYVKLLEWASVNYPYQVKELDTIVNDWDEFTQWYEVAQDEKIEGYVVEDDSGFCFKIKNPYYSFWKYMRSIKDRILRLRKTVVETDECQMSDLGKNIEQSEVRAFVEWAWKQDDVLLEKDIITIRKIYFGE